MRKPITLGDIEEYDTVICRVCLKEMGQLSSHIRTHGMTKEEYLFNYPGAKLQSQKILDSKSKKLSGTNNPRFGKESPFKGKTHTDEVKEVLKEKGRLNLTPERLKKLVGNPVTGDKHWTRDENNKYKFTGSNNPFYGRTHTEESKRKMSKNNSSHRPEVRRKLSDAMRNRYSKGYRPPQRNTNTKPHLQCKDILIKLGMSYQEEVPCKRFYFDFKVEDLFYVEVNGDYWHAHPHKFKVLNHIQERRVKMDILKSNISDLPILYLWESDLNSCMSHCEDLILRMSRGVSTDTRIHSYEEV